MERFHSAYVVTISTCHRRCQPEQHSGTSLQNCVLWNLLWLNSSSARFRVICYTVVVVIIISVLSCACCDMEMSIALSSIEQWAGKVLEETYLWTESSIL